MSMRYFVPPLTTQEFPKCSGLMAPGAPPEVVSLVSVVAQLGLKWIPPPFTAGRNISRGGEECSGDPCVHAIELDTANIS